MPDESLAMRRRWMQADGEELLDQPVAAPPAEDPDVCAGLPRWLCVRVNAHGDWVPLAEEDAWPRSPR